MDDRAYTHLVRRLEVESTINPAAFRAKVLLVSVSAYIALFGTLLCIAALLYFSFGFVQSHRGHSTSRVVGIVFLAMAALPIFYIVLRACFLRLEPPQGVAVTRQDAPKLFEILDKVRAKLQGPPIHHVLIDETYNAAISQVPRFGLFGGHTNYLILGFPFLLGGTPKESVATIAHEYGHLRGNHGKFGSWVYRQRLIFRALDEHVRHTSEDSLLDALFNKALRHFMPRYYAYTFVLSRQDEYEADKAAAQLVGARAMVDGLVRCTLLGRWIHREFWPRLYRQADTATRPAFLPYQAMRTAFKASHEQWATRENLQAAWMERSGLLDTHPALRDRVEATGEAAALPPPVSVTAAEALLGPALVKELIERFDRQWWKAEKADWEARCKYATRSRARLKELSAKPLAEVPLQDLQEYALLTAEFDSPQAAKPILEHLLKKDGGPFPRAAFIYGRILIDEDNRRGLDYLESAAINDRDAIEDVAYIGFYYLLRKESEYSARQWWERITALWDE